MKSDRHKVVFPLCGRPMIGYVLDALRGLSVSRVVVVVGHRADEVRKAAEASWLGEPSCLRFALQRDRKGTGHAILASRDEVLTEAGANVLVVCGDTPLLTTDLLSRFIESHHESKAGLSIITSVLEDAGPYGRVVRGANGDVQRIVEAKDLTEAEKDIREVNAGVYYAGASLLFELLEEVQNQNSKGEYYATDVVGIAARSNAGVDGFRCDDVAAVKGINDRWELASAEEELRLRILKGLALSGVTIRDPGATYVDFGVRVAKDTVLEPGTHLRGKTEIGEGCVVGPGTELLDVRLGDRSKVWASVVEHSDIGEDVQVGPFAHIRPNTKVEKNALVGNFAEVKNSVIGKGSKVHHHSYLGDSDIGEGVNIGAGTVTVNYDGSKKHRTVIGDGAFIGCNANLIAPVMIGCRSYVAAGSTITSDVPEGSLAIARERQILKEGWVERKKERGQGR